MLKRPAVVAAALAVMAAGCGGSGAERTSADRSPSPPAGTASPGAAQAGSQDDSRAGGRDPGDAKSPEDPAATAPSITSGPVRPAAAGTVNRPKAGLYVYDLSGTRPDPSTGQPREYSPDARMNVDVTISGDEYTARATTNEDPGGSTTAKTRWEASRVLLVQTVVSFFFGDVSCTYVPPAEVLRIPLKQETWQVRWQSAECEGQSSFGVVRREKVSDATGKEWDAWIVVNQTTYKFGSLSGTIAGTTWFAPDLGTIVKMDQQNDSSFGGQGFSSRQVTLLRRHP